MVKSMGKKGCYVKLSDLLFISGGLVRSCVSITFAWNSYFNFV